MADRDADNDNADGSVGGSAGGSADDNWVMPIPARGKPAYAVMPWALFERLRAPLAAAPDGREAVALHDDLIAAPVDLWHKTESGIDGYDDEAAAGAIPLDLLDRLLDGEHPLKVFRRHRGLTQKQLAQRTGLNATYLSQIETRKRGGSTRVYRLLAAALNVEIGDLIE